MEVEIFLKIVPFMLPACRYIWSSALFIVDIERFSTHFSLDEKYLRYSLHDKG